MVPKDAYIYILSHSTNLDRRPVTAVKIQEDAKETQQFECWMRAQKIPQLEMFYVAVEGQVQVFNLG